MIAACACRADVRVRLVVQLDVELHAPDAREIVLARIEEHALEQLGRRIDGRRIARTQLAVDFEQRFVLLLDAVFPERHRNHVAHVVELREEHVERLDAASISWR